MTVWNNRSDATDAEFAEVLDRFEAAPHVCLTCDQIQALIARLETKHRGTPYEAGLALAGVEIRRVGAGLS